MVDIKRSDNLSQTMIDCLNIMDMQGGELVRWDGGFWTHRNSRVDSILKTANYPDCNVPEWYCTVKTLRVLHKRGFVDLDEANGLCKIINKEQYQNIVL